MHAACRSVRLTPHAASPFVAVILIVDMNALLPPYIFYSSLNACVIIALPVPMPSVDESTAGTIFCHRSEVAWHLSRGRIKRLKSKKKATSRSLCFCSIFRKEKRIVQ